MFNEPLAQVCEPVRWKERDATRLTNGVVELICLQGGGHLASLRFLGDGRLSENVLWEAPWETLDPVHSWSDELSQIYGPREIGRFLASYTGHALCLDYFGEPSTESAAVGLSLHGEAAITQWDVVQSTESEKVHCRWSAAFKTKQLAFDREIYLNEGESVAYVQETVHNERDVEHRCDWVQHVTFGPPFLCEGESTLEASVLGGVTWPSSYEGKSLLADGQQFMWPLALREGVNEYADLRKPFSIKGRSFLAGMQLDPVRENEFVLAINWKSRLGVGYCFRLRDFPWMTIWEENHTRKNSPWNGRVAARGMEFGTTPLPYGESSLSQQRHVFDSLTNCVIPALGKKTAKYLIFLFELPSNVQSIHDVATVGNAILLYDEHCNPALSLPAHGCEAFLA